MSQPELAVSFQDILDGRAYIRIPFVGKLLLCHWAGAPWSDKDIGACLHPLQVEVLAHREREKIVHGASRLGKSVLGGCDLVIAMMQIRRKVAVVAKRYDHVAHEFQYLISGMRALFKGHGQAFKRFVFKHQMAYHDYDVDTIWDSRAIGISVEADEGAQLLGRELTDVVCGEGSHIPVDVFNTKLLRALDSAAALERSHGAEEEIGRISIYTTPRGYEGASAAEWDRIIEQTQRQPEKLHYGNCPYISTAWVREASILENPAYDRKVYDARKKTLDRRAFQEQYQGRMTFASGLVYSYLNPDTHFVERPSPTAIRKMRLGVGIDTGAMTAMMLLGIDEFNNKWVLGEAYTEKQTIWTTMEAFDDVLLDVLGDAWPEATVDMLHSRIDVWGIDPASQHKFEIMDYWEDAGLTSPNTSDTKDLLATIGTVARWIEDQQFYITNDCLTAQHQIRRYQWKTTRSRGAAAPVVKEPKKEHDHTLDAIRIGLILLNGLGPMEEAPPPVTIAEAWEMARRENIHGPLREVLKKAGEKEDSYARMQGLSEERRGNLLAKGDGDEPNGRRSRVLGRGPSRGDGDDPGHLDSYGS